MKLLIITQKVDRRDPVLGFFHQWLLKLSSSFDKLTVICLEHAEDELSDQIKILSLGKENGPSRLKYLLRFYEYLWQERGNYDAVFVHMNQEYILLAGWWWWILGKKVYLWRNHHSGNWLTDVAIFFCQNVFCTSQYSYTAKYQKTILMPVGIDTAIFKPDDSLAKLPNSILFIARMAPVKKPHILLEALKKISDWSVIFQADFYGNPLPPNENYYRQLKKEVTVDNLGDRVHFYLGVPNTEITPLYNRHEIFVNLSSSGMYDKTIFEAMSCGSLVLVSNKNLDGEIDPMFLFQEGDAIDLAQKLKRLLLLSPAEKRRLAADLKSYSDKYHSLDLLVKKLTRILIFYHD